MKTNLNVDTQVLREKILDLAMRGKLVEQDAGDEPASVLLEKIKAEKAELVKEGKIKKSKKLPEIADDEKPFDIPDSWEWVRLGDVGDWGAGATPLKSNHEYYKGGTIPWILTGDLNDGHISSANQFITEKALNETSVKIKPIGSVLIAMYGATIGKLGILDIEATTNQACCACVTFSGVSNMYLFDYLKFMKPKFIESGVGGAQPNISRTKIVATPIPLPPLAEQKRIADKVSELFKQVEVIEKNVTEYQDLEQAMRSKLLDLAMRGKLVEQDLSDEPASELVKQIQAEKAELVKKGKIKKSKKLPEITDDEKPFDIPDSWEWVRLGDINEYMGRSINPQEYGEEKFELYSVPVFKKNYPEILSGSEIKSSKQNVFFDDVLLCKINPRINRVWVVSNFTEFESIASSEWIVIRQPNVDSSFLKYCLSAPYFRAAIQENVSGVGGSLTRAKPAIVKELIIPLPPFAEQKRIADKLTRLFEDLDTIKQNLTTVS